MFNTSIPKSTLNFQTVRSIDEVFDVKDGFEPTFVYTPSGNFEVEQIVNKMRSYLNETKKG